MSKFLYPILVLLLLSATALTTSAQNWLYIQATQPPWQGGEGSIDSVEIYIKPQGIYSRVDLTMSLSARGHEFVNADSLEIIYGFRLPDYAFIADSWLWVGEEPVQAEMLDSWSAFRVYESIVNRRLDPSLLTKYGAGPENNFYQIRIFPMAGDEARKIRMTFHIPTEWTEEWVSVALPTLDWFHSYKPIQSFTLQVEETTDFGAPVWLGADATFQQKNGEGDRVYHELVLEDPLRENLTSEIVLGFESPLEEGLYVRTFPESPTEGIYELVFLPEWAIADTLSKNVLVLVDLHGPTTRFKERDMANYLRSLIGKHISPQDSFNIIFSAFSAQGGTTALASRWIGGNEDLSQWLAPNVLEEYMGTVSNLPTLLLDASTFIDENSRPNGIVLLSSSDLYGSPEVANELVDKLEISEEWPPVHIVDFANQYPIQGYNGPTYYFQGNEYLYTQLVRLTGGELYKVWDNSEMGEKLDAAFFQTYAVLDAFDMHTSLADGFCYDRFTLEASTRTRSIERPIRQLGRYFGSFPFQLEVYGTLNDSLFFLDYEVNPTQAEGEGLRKAWTANLIMDMEVSRYNNRSIAKLIELSIDNRILSTYTSFLALEPWMNLDSLLANADNPNGGCLECDVVRGGPFAEGPNVGTVSITEEVPSSEWVEVFPNPFTERIRISVDLPTEVLLGEELTWTIYDGLGRIITEESLVLQNSRVSLQWDGKNRRGGALPDGIYFIRITYDDQLWFKRVLKGQE